MKANQILLALALMHDGDWNDIFNCIQNKKIPSNDEMENAIKDFTGNFITILDEEYPEGLKQAYKPPFVLFYDGNLDLLTNNPQSKLTIADEKHTNDTYRKQNNMLLQGAKDTTLVLIGETETNGYLINNHKYRIIKVQSSYNPLEKGNDNLLVLSETYGKGNSKYESSRIASAISEKLLVFNCGVHSPVIMAVNYFLQAGKEVLVKPTDIGNPNINNMLIYQGAIPVYNDISLQDQLQS